uniref:Bcl-2 Bcl-2 homology region 1-3 domain-containing protein n=1 Tax=Knipowitschia caucasica TaxID=637954 RepID=A0AAV2M1L2_KNICA
MGFTWSWIRKTKIETDARRSLVDDERNCYYLSRRGVNWGRVVGLFAFGGALCVECVDKDMSHLVQRIVGWMTVYLDEHIQDWIDQQGGWDVFADLYGGDAAAMSRRSEESFRQWLFAGVTLVTGVVVGSLLVLAHRRL